MATDDLRIKLAAPFKPSDVEWRIGTKSKDGTKGMALAYITSRAVMDRLDECFGIGGWQDRYERWGDKGVVCRLACRVGDEWIERMDGADESDIEPTKGGISNALKRAAVKWGIGRYLYDLPSSWVALTGSGQVFAGKGQYFNPPALPKWALPEGVEPESAPKEQAATPPQAAAEPEPITETDMKRLHAVGKERGLDHDAISRAAKALFPGFHSLKDITREQAKKLTAAIEKAADEKLARFKEVAS